jgi:uncharacterized metal-binding protein
MNPIQRSHPHSILPHARGNRQLAAIEQTYLEDVDLRKWACESARTESASYCRNTRIQEIMDFARRIGATRLGIAHCDGLVEEPEVAREIFLGNVFEVEATGGKVGSIDKEKVGVKDAEKVHSGQFEA